MLIRIRNIGLTLVAALAGALVMGLAVLIALPILFVATVVSFVLMRPVRARLSRMRAGAMRGATIEGEYTVIDERDPVDRSAYR
jgi:membrane protein implicated in regulation of membrane protease activity